MQINAAYNPTGVEIVSSLEETKNWNNLKRNLLAGLSVQFLFYSSYDLYSPFAETKEKAKEEIKSGFELEIMVALSKLNKTKHLVMASANTSPLFTIGEELERHDNVCVWGLENTLNRAFTDFEHRNRANSFPARKELQANWRKLFIDDKRLVIAINGNYWGSFRSALPDFCERTSRVLLYQRWCNAENRAYYGSAQFTWSERGQYFVS